MWKFLIIELFIRHAHNICEWMNVCKRVSICNYKANKNIQKEKRKRVQNRCQVSEFFSLLLSICLVQSGSYKKPLVLALGDCIPVRPWSDSPIACIAELRMVWRDKNEQCLLASLRLYFLPENTPIGRNCHGEVSVDIYSVLTVSRIWRQWSFDFGHQGNLLFFLLRNSEQWILSLDHLCFNFFFRIFNKDGFFFFEKYYVSACDRVLHTRWLRPCIIRSKKNHLCEQLGTRSLQVSLIHNK